MLKKSKTVRIALLLLLLIFALTGCACQDTRRAPDSAPPAAGIKAFHPIHQPSQTQLPQMENAMAADEQPAAIPAAGNQAIPVTSAASVTPAIPVTPAASVTPAIPATPAALVASAFPVTPAASVAPAVDPQKPMVALTFDDGPHNTVTPAILDALKKADGRATFFVVGKRSAGLSYILKRMVAEGNEVANHSYSHPNLARLSAVHIRSQISLSDAVIEKATGSLPRLARPPYGAINERVKQNIDRPLIMWSIDTKDWKTRNSQKTISTILNNVRDGDIILMHDIYQATGVAAAAVIPKLKEKGFQLVTVSELMQAKGIEAGKGQIVYKCR